MILRNPASVEATVHDPDGPRLRRALPYAVGLLFLIVGGILWKLTHHFGFLGIAGVALALGGPPLLGRQKPTRARVLLFPGRLELPRRTIRTREIVGASAARRIDGGYTLALAIKGSTSPVQVEVATLDELKMIRDVLGIGHSGFGAVSFTTAPRGIDSVFDVSAMLVALGFAITAFARLFSSTVGIAEGLFSLSIFGGGVLSFLALLKYMSVLPRLTISENGVTVRGTSGRRFDIPYPSIHTLTGSDDTLVLLGSRRDQVLAIRTPKVKHARHGLTREEGALLRAQLASAMARTRGEGPLRVDPSERVAVLERRGEPARSWLARVEAAASTAVSSGYRGSALAEDDLWAVAEDHDADADARAAAMRVLTRVAPDRARVRVNAIVQSIHDEASRNRIRVALEPNVEAAAAELEALELRQARK